MMNSNTALIMFAVIAAFGLATATLVLPLVPQAHAAPVAHPSQCHNQPLSGSEIGACARIAASPPGRPS